MKNWMYEIRENDKMAALKQVFPGKGCGNPDCEQLCATALQIARNLNLRPANFILNIILRDVAPQNKCFLYKSDFPQNIFTPVCRFGFVKTKLKEKDFDDVTQIIVGKKYIAEAGFSKNGSCQKCLKYANRIFKWPEEAKLMPKLPIHPNCKCHYENVYEEEKKTFMINMYYKGFEKKL